ncbi:hypothetical protein [Marinifilum sp. D737]|uniref:hypothetical protein n=1 Tax=Marinifilum sp. D737 TaxID=2969628 RepID=UPI002273A1A5|nr:hypothetical protein [Marinifilum sp. D737]MCY1632914.1 hypothetical protein [Marinifilum sp. D737]
MKKIKIILILSLLSCQFTIAQQKVSTSLRVGAGMTVNAGIDGLGFSMELPVGVTKFLELSPSVSYARIAPNYETDYSHRVYPDNSKNSLSYGGRSYELGTSNFFKSADSQFGIDLNLRIKPLVLFKKEGKFDFAIGVGYGYKSGIDLMETSSDDGNYWITHQSWNSMEWNPILVDVNYQLNNRHKLGIHFNDYGGNDGYTLLGIHFITKL